MYIDVDLLYKNTEGTLEEREILIRKYFSKVKLFVFEQTLLLHVAVIDLQS